jgi:para-nitrobenzyl esterase
MKTTRRLFLGAAAFAAVTPVSFAAPMRANPEAAIASGRLRGRARGEVAEFLGVPYGADTKTTRFKAPRPRAGWTGVRTALEHGAACPQGGDTPTPKSEDCLVLNVWTPTLDRNAKKPVLFYIHGGGFSGGTGSSPVTDGAELAKRGDAVVLTLNHRLNIFGHLYLGRVSEDAAYGPSGNAGLLDLVLALTWVRDNIAAFGGDPGCVTVFGQSGGGAKIATLMAMPAARGLFHRAWTMSGQQVTAQGPRGATGRAKAALTAIAGNDAASAASLDALTVDQIMLGLAARDPTIANGRVYWGPVLDEVSLPIHPFWPEAPAQSAAIPMVMGNTREETGSLIGGSDRSLLQLTWDALPARLERDMVTDIDVRHVIRVYRELYPSITPTQLFFRATTSGRSWRGQVIEAEARARQGAPTWVYQLNWPSPRDGGAWGAFHTLDIPLVLHNTAGNADTGDGPEARALSAAMSDALLRFARTGDPGGGSLGAWPKYDLGARGTMIFDASNRVENDPRKVEREMFGKAPYIQAGTY